MTGRVREQLLLPAEKLASKNTKSGAENVLFREKFRSKIEIFSNHNLVTKVGEQEVGSCSFPTDSCNFATEEIGLWVLKILILPLNSFKMGNFWPKILYF